MNNKLIGTSSLVIAALIFSLYGVFSRYIYSDFGIFYQSASRYFIGILIFSFLGILGRKFKKIKKSDWKYLGLQAFFNFGVNIPFFVSVVNLPLGTALFLFYASSVIFSYIYGYLVLKEKITPVKIAALFLALLGILLIYHGNFKLFNSIYIFTAIIAGGFYGLYTSSSKMVSLKYSAVQINLIAYIIVFLLTLPFVILFRENIYLDFTSFSWEINFLYALAVTATGFLIVYGFKYIEAQIGSLILLSELIFVIFVGYIFFKEVPGSYVIFGGLFILLAMILPHINQFHQKYKI